MKKAIIAYWLAAAVWGQVPTAAKIAAIEKSITAEMSQRRIPGLSIAVGDRSGQIWANGYGMADLENFVPAKGSSVYRTASVAKPMTAVAAMQLAERGKLDLDAPVQKYLKSFPDKQWAVTSRQLLGHLGGVRSYKDVFETYNTKHYASVADALSLFEQDPLLHEPGTTYAYSTYGYVLAGRVVEVVSGEPFMEYMRRNVFDVAEMRATQADDVYALVPNRVRGYQRQQDGELRNAPLLDTSGRIPGGGFSATAGDLVRFALAFDGAKLVSPASQAEMLRPMTTRAGKLTGYGMGWGMHEKNGNKFVTHSGGQSGVSTLLVYLPEKHLAVAIMVNLEGQRLQELAESVVEVLLKP